MPLYWIKWLKMPISGHPAWLNAICTHGILSLHSRSSSSVFLRLSKESCTVESISVLVAISSRMEFSCSSCSSLYSSSFRLRISICSRILLCISWFLRHVSWWSSSNFINSFCRLSTSAWMGRETIKNQLRIGWPEMWAIDTKYVHYIRENMPKLSLMTRGVTSQYF